MNERQKLFKQIKEYEKHLGKLRLKWFLGIWLGYSAAILFLLSPHGFADALDFFGNLFVAVVLGLIFWIVSGAVWSHCIDSLGGRTKYLEELEKKYNNMD